MGCCFVVGGGDKHLIGQTIIGSFLKVRSPLNNEDDMFGARTITHTDWVH